MSGHGRQRQDLQGLRAIAVLLVALDHARLSALAGGYVGVDVFFVLSGFFITGQLLREGFEHAERRAPAGVSIRNFYYRRAKRILPAACLTLFVTNVAVYKVYNFVRAEQVLHDSWAASIFMANVHFAQSSTDYFAQAQGVISPVQHFWSLAVEEQFYVVWPALLAAVFLLVHETARWGRESADAERRIWRLLGLVIVASLAWSVYETRTSPQAAYFSTFARGWELGLGAVVALAARRIGELRPAAAGAISTLGLAMIAAAALLFTSATPFPGYAALLPTVGSALIVLASFTPRAHGASRLLTWQPLPFIGDRSYTFYLWHFPALTIAAEAAGRGLSAVESLLVLAGAFALSCLTYAAFENPLRRMHWSPQRSAWALAAAFCTVLLSLSVPLRSVHDQALARDLAASGKKVAALADTASGGDSVKVSDRSAAKPAPIPAVVAAAARPDAKIPGDLTPAVSELPHDDWSPPGGCMPAENGVSSRICRLGDAAAKKTIVVLGDSHAKMWMPAVLRAAVKRRFAVVPLVHVGCMPYRLTTSQFNCDKWYRWAKQQARRLRPEATLVGFMYDAGFSSATAEDATMKAIDGALRSLPNPVLIEDPPQQRMQPVDCLLKRNARMGTCTTTRPDSSYRMVDAVAQIAGRRRAPVVPTIQWFCTERGACPTVINGTAAFHDQNHISKTYANELGPLFAKQLTRTLRAAARAPTA